MDNTNFPQNGLSVESTISIKAEYHADSHSVNVTLNGAPFGYATTLNRQRYAGVALDVLGELECSLMHQYNTDPEEVERLISKARNNLNTD
jgi:hypothetical protein